MILTDGTISLRALEPEDVDILFGWENDTDVWDDGATIAPFSRALLADYVVKAEGEESIGTIDLYDFDPRNRRCGVGILIAAPYRRCGYAAAALRLLINYCSRHLGIHQLYCVAGVDNVASRQTFLSTGFKIAGKLRSWIRSGQSYRDAFIMQLLLQ